MGHISVTLNARTYRLRCGEGESARLIALADLVQERFKRLHAQFGNVGDERLLLMAALLIADELMDAKAMLEDLTVPEIVSEPAHGAGAAQGPVLAPVQRRA